MALNITPERAIAHIETFAEMVNLTDEDFENAEYPEETRKQHQEHAKFVLDQWLDTVDAPNEIRARVIELLRWT